VGTSRQSQKGVSNHKSLQIRAQKTTCPNLKNRFRCLSNFKNPLQNPCKTQKSIFG
jgi:hypothetical protein